MRKNKLDVYRNALQADGFAVDHLSNKELEDKLRSLAKLMVDFDLSTEQLANNAALFFDRSPKES